MGRQRNDDVPGINVNFRSDRKVYEDFKLLVEREERTVSQDLRLYMANRVAQARRDELEPAA